jgi:hypothetical protein
MSQWYSMATTNILSIKIEITSLWHHSHLYNNEAHIGTKYGQQSMLTAIHNLSSRHVSSSTSEGHLSDQPQAHGRLGGMGRNTRYFWATN